MVGANWSVVGGKWSVVGGMVGGRWIYTRPEINGETQENQNTKVVVINRTEEEQLPKEPSIEPANVSETQIIGETQDNQNIKVVVNK